LRADYTILIQASSSRVGITRIRTWSSLMGGRQDKVEADIHPVAAFAIGSAHGAIFFDAHHRESTCSAN